MIYVYKLLKRELFVDEIHCSRVQTVKLTLIYKVMTLNISCINIGTFGKLRRHILHMTSFVTIGWITKDEVCYFIVLLS